MFICCENRDFSGLGALNNYFTFVKNVLYLIVPTLTSLHKTTVKKKQSHKLDKFRRVDLNNLILFVMYCVRAASFILAD